MGYEFMNGAGMMSGWGMAFGGLMMIIWFAVMVAVVVFVVRWLSGQSTPLTGKKDGTADAHHLLQQRYAKGEIDSADFDERVKKLRETQIP